MLLFNRYNHKKRDKDNHRDRHKIIFVIIEAERQQPRQHQKRQRRTKDRHKIIFVIRYNHNEDSRDNHKIIFVINATKETKTDIKLFLL